MEKEFVKNNPDSSVKDETEHFKIERPWNDDSFIIQVDKTKATSKTLSSIALIDYLAAIYHLDKDELEFIFAPLDPDAISHVKHKTFQFNYNGDSFECGFAESSKALEILATGFQQTKGSSKTNFRELMMFHDFFTLNEQPDYIQDFFKKSKPYSFFVKGKLSQFKPDFRYFLKLLNFYLQYFERESPQIIIYSKPSNQDEHTVPCYSTDASNFPDVINANQIDVTILETLSIAHKSENSRLEFIFYFQVLEYCSYYYLDRNIKSELNKILKKPDINSKSKEYTRNILEHLQDHFNKFRNDSDKMEKVIMEFLSYDDIVLEIIENAEYFCSDLEFEGGLVIPKLFNEKKDIETGNNNMLTTIRRNIEKIRNVLVHLREQRENKVILPTPDNDRKLLPYLFLVKRIAEKVAIQFE